VETLVRSLEERVHGLAVARVVGHSDRQPEALGQVARIDGGLDPSGQALGQALARVRLALEQRQRELVAAPAAREARAAQELARQCRRLPEDTIPLEVAVRVVDALELVEVEERQRQPVTVAGGPLELELELAPEGAVVEERGQRVAPRAGGELRGGVVEVRDD